MIKNYFLVAVRHAMHNRLSSLINIVGLAVGMACGLLMLMLIQDDLGYDRQFAIAVGLLIATLVVYEQMRFLFTRHLGFDRDHVVVIPLTDSKLRKGFDALKTALLQHPQVLGNFIAWPVAWWVMHRWLQNFAYRIDLGLGTLLLGGTLVVVIALSTVSLQAFKAALINPVDALRYE